MNLNKTELENIIEEKREKIKELNNTIDSLKEEILQIEKENRVTLKAAEENNKKFKQMSKLFKKESKKEKNGVQFHFHKLLGEV